MLNRSPRPRGFTIAEVLVALVVAAVGLLALVGADTLAWNRRRRADHRVDGALLARSRVERLDSRSCTSSVVDGTASRDGVHERWTIRSPSHGPRFTEATVSWPSSSHAGRDSVHLSSSRWCE